MSNGAVERRGVQLSQRALEHIAAHAEESYPQECCGFLLGHFEGGVIQMFRPAQNVNVSRPCDRYEMDPQEFLQAQTEAERWGGEVIGFYHSHPDAVACPSTTDHERALEEYLYLIVPVVAGQAEKARLWRLAAVDGPFSELILQIIEMGEENSCPS
jgi:proteasome lid subunit RPN8/RPN11